MVVASSTELFAVTGSVSVAPIIAWLVMTAPSARVAGTAATMVTATFCSAANAPMLQFTVPLENVQLADAGDADKARALHYELMEINDVMFIETNPVPAKTALALMGKIDDELRSPLAPLISDNLEKLKLVLRQYSLIS
ncbi:MAG: dihydrodipicolinate synthase family protein [Nitrospinae bacterium]|nr:dihydrodipicolinate synthase family protein [Nitrospinota bacterium]